MRLTLLVDVERWLPYKGTYHVILLAKLHDMYLCKTDNFFHINHYLKSVSKVALLHKFHCTFLLFIAQIIICHLSFLPGACLKFVSFFIVFCTGHLSLGFLEEIFVALQFYT